MKMPRPTASTQRPHSAPGGRLLVLFFAIVAGIALGSGLYLRSLQAQARRKAHEELQAIADMKVRQIAAWRAERRSDARFFSQAMFVARDVAAFLAAPESEAARRETLHWLNLLKGGDRYAQVALFDTNLNERLAVAPWESPPDPPTRARLAEAVQTRAIIVGDIERGTSNAPPRLDIAAPVFSPPARGESATSNAPVQAVLLLRLDPGQFLYPLVQTWPTPSPSAETMLVRREGDAVVFLNELRHRAGAALSLRLPLSQTNVPAVRGALGMVGVLDGPDYRGVPVVAVVRPVPDSSWLLVAKVDRAELYAPLRRQTLAVGSVAAALGLAGLLGTALLWRQRDAALLQQQLAAEQERAALAQRLAQLMDNANDIILLADEDGRILEANRRATEAYGWTMDELRSMTLSDLQAQGATPEPQGQAAQPDTTGRAVFETLHRRKDGTTFPVEVSARLVDVGDERVNLALVRDITRRKEIETTLRHSELKYHTLFETANDALLLMRQDRFLDCNARAAAMFGCAREDLIQATPWDFSPPAQPDGRPSREKAAEMIHRALTEGPQFFEWEHCRRDGTPFSAEVSLNRMELGPEVVLLAIVRDVTERKRAEIETLRRSHELAIISDLVHATATTLDLPTVLDTALRGALALTGLEGGTICLVNPELQSLELAAQINTSPETVRDLTTNTVRVGECLCGECARTCEPFILWDHASASPFATREATRQEGIRFHAAFPLLVPGRRQSAPPAEEDRPTPPRNSGVAAASAQADAVSAARPPAAEPAEAGPSTARSTTCIGVLCIFSKTEAKPTPRSLQLVKDLCGPIALTIANARLYETVQGHVAELERQIHERKRAEEALRAKTEELDRYFTGSLDLLCIADTEGFFRRLNPEWERALGYPLSELENRRFLDLVHPDDVAATVEAMRRLASGAHVTNFLNRYRHRDGSYRWIEWRSYSTGDRIYAVARDVTERKLAEEALRNHDENLARLLEISKMLAGSLDLRQVLQAATDGATALTGLQSAAIYLLEADGLRLWATTPPLESQVPEAFRRASLADHPHIGRAIVTGQPVLLPDAAAADLTAAERLIVEARGLRTLLYLPLVAGEQVLGALIVGTVGAPQPISEPQIDLCRTLANLAALAIANARLYQEGQRHVADLEREIGERKRAEAALQESERKYRELVEHANSIILRWNRAGEITFLNEFGQRFFGYTQAEILGRHVVGTIVPESESTGRDLRPLMAQICANPAAFEQNVNENMRRNGERVWIAWTNKVVLDDTGQVKEILSVGTDITARRQAEVALEQSRAQLRALTARLQAAREEESRRIARELHDELGQVLTGLKMDLRRVERDLEETAPDKTGQVLERVLAASELADAAIRTVQRISSELRPGLLDKLGLAAALRHEARLFQQRTGITCRVTVPDPEPQMPQEIATACYRVCQEALTNVARHAAASEVQIELRAEGADGQQSARAEQRGGGWVLEVRDDGRGIPPEKLADPHSLGLLGMEERARALGGKVHIAPARGGGTIVRLRIPAGGGTTVCEP